MAKPQQQVLERKVWGNKTGPTMFLLCGWPDTCEIWESNVVPQFAEEYRMVGFNLPGFTKESAAKRPLLGWSFDEVTTMLAASLKEAMLDDHTGLRPVVVAHDWGSLFIAEFLLRQPRFFRKVVYLDAVSHIGELETTTLAGKLVGPHFSMSVPNFLFIMWYQLLLAAAFVLSYTPFNFLGQMVANYFSKNAGCPGYNRNSLAGTKESGHEGVHTGMGYLYLQLWMLILTGRAPFSVKYFRAPLVPVLFCYGEKKPITFHSESWLKHLASRKDGSRAISYVGNHWFFTDPKRPAGAQFLADLTTFLKA